MGKLDKLDSAQKNEIVSMYVSGKTLKEVAKKFSCTSPTVAVFLRKNGHPIRGKGKRGVKATPTVFDVNTDMVEEEINEMTADFEE